MIAEDMRTGESFLCFALSVVNYSLLFLFYLITAKFLNADVHKFPFLHARVFTVVSKFSSLVIILNYFIIVKLSAVAICEYSHF